MGKYTVIAGQNIYDVALHLYGSIEGIVDLMMNNASLSLDDTLTAGQELTYTEGFLINADIVAHYSRYGIVPANGERPVYPKIFTQPEAVRFFLSGERKAVSFTLSGTGTLEIDWGDNSLVETVALSGTVRAVSHLFDSDIRGNRRIRWFTGGSFRQLDWSGIKAERILLLRPFSVEELVVRDCGFSLLPFSLLEDVYRLDLQASSVTGLASLVPLTRLMSLDLTDTRMKPQQADEYLTGLVRHYGNRRSCEVRMSVVPTGEYREPERDENGRCIISTGMEAVWVILHETAWNEGGHWRFIINEQIYTIEE